MEMDEIDGMMNRGEAINPLLWSVEDKLRYCCLVMKYCSGVMEHLLADLFGFEGEGIAEMDGEDRLTAFCDFDKMMMMGHNVHSVMQSALTPNQRLLVLKDKMELMTGEPVGEIVGTVGNFIVARPYADAVPDDLSELEDEKEEEEDYGEGEEDE